MNFLTDKTGRFQKRPYYKNSELDQLLENIIISFMTEKCGSFRLPIPTDALTKLIENEAEDLDLYADLAVEEGKDVEGITIFVANGKPRVKIKAELSEAKNENRLRTTLSHEYGHVRLHSTIPMVPQVATVSVNHQQQRDNSARCSQDLMFNAHQTDWVEWQAGYACGALLMPISSLRELFENFTNRYPLPPQCKSQSLAAIPIIREVARSFAVSTEAARIRLIKVGYLEK